MKLRNKHTNSNVIVNYTFKKNENTLKKSFAPKLIALLTICIFSLPAIGQTNLDKQNWIYGSEDCQNNTDEPIQVVQYDQNTWILRQNKCTNYEAPFMFLFLGQDKALLIDTGATKEEESFPLYNKVNTIIDNWLQQRLKFIACRFPKHLCARWAGKSNTYLLP